MTKIFFHYFILTLILCIPIAYAIDISTNAKQIGDTFYVTKGEKVDILISGVSSQEFEVSIDYFFTLKPFDGQYYFSQNKFQIPISSSFEVKAYPVRNLTVEAKLWIFKKKLSAEAKNGVAVVKADVPAGRYDVKFYGVSEGNNVNVESRAFSKVKLDDQGEFKISYDSSYLPEGEMIVRVESKIVKVKIISGSPNPTTVPPSLSPSPSIPNALNETDTTFSIEIEPAEASINVNETLKLKIKIRNEAIGSLAGLKVFWTINSSIIEIVDFEMETNLLGEAKATIKAISSGKAIVKAEIPDLNISAVALIYVQNEGFTNSNSSEIIENPNTTQATIPETITTNPNTLNTPTPTPQKRVLIPGFGVVLTLTSIAILLLIRKLRNR